MFYKFSHFHTIPECDEHTDRQTDTNTETGYDNSIALHGKNG